MEDGDGEVLPAGGLPDFVVVFSDELCGLDAVLDFPVPSPERLEPLLEELRFDLDVDLEVVCDESLPLLEFASWP